MFYSTLLLSMYFCHIVYKVVIWLRAGVILFNSSLYKPIIHAIRPGLPSVLTFPLILYMEIWSSDYAAESPKSWALWKYPSGNIGLRLRLQSHNKTADKGPRFGDRLLLINRGSQLILNPMRSIHILVANVWLDNDELYR